MEREKKEIHCIGCPKKKVLCPIQTFYLSKIEPHLWVQHSKQTIFGDFLWDEGTFFGTYVTWSSWLWSLCKVPPWFLEFEKLQLLLERWSWIKYQKYIRKKKRKELLKIITRGISIIQPYLKYQRLQNSSLRFVWITPY